MKNKNIEKYLLNYAEKESFYFDDFNYAFNNVITIPAYNETFKDIKFTLDSIHDENTLVILVVNSQENSIHEAKESNQKLIKDIINNFATISKNKVSGNISLYKYNDIFILLIDRTTNNLQLPEKTGVGLARKIAADIATKLIYDGKIVSNWIHCTDSDVVLPINYFQRTKELIDYSAAIYPYIHRDISYNNTHKEAIALYEISLRHYVNGLKYASSNFAFHTIGSTIAINIEAYANVRGFPVRESGEDFYILNKLAKVGNIISLKNSPIILDGRISDRVPFGTGKSVQKIINLENSENEFLFYNSTIFEKLKIFISVVSNVDNLSNIKKTINDEILSKTLDKIGAFDALNTAMKSSKNPKIYLQHFHHWFDNFRTLKFIHHMRDNYYPSMPIKEIIKQPLYATYNLTSLQTLEELLQEFRKLSGL